MVPLSGLITLNFVSLSLYIRRWLMQMWTLSWHLVVHLLKINRLILVNKTLLTRLRTWYLSCCGTGWFHHRRRVTPYIGKCPVLFYFVQNYARKSTAMICLKKLTTTTYHQSKRNIQICCTVADSRIGFKLTTHFLKHAQ